MRRNNNKKCQLRSSTRTFKQQPMVNCTNELEVINHISRPDVNGLIYGSYKRDYGDGVSEQDDSSPNQNNFATSSR
ncbi:hypothetical protein OUZ56_019926 [Daphnia magna]|uniref:Uncharacterized protein n=1 Tax=Daphnia magna TaxID=35525 RepID=A0ABQ9ZDQ8_9CRUS|nr:hypothetical protein OUZ56_019926 [Daphnia magna]